MRTNTRRGFTIVELLIVIVIIGTLAALVVVGYNGIQDRARQTQIASDQALLIKAIRAARVANGDVALRYVTLSTATASPCVAKASGTDLATLNKTTDACWINYTTALQRISTAANIDLTKLVDPWGRPYYLDENEGEYACPTADTIGIYKNPHVTGWGQINNGKSVPTATC